MTKHITHVHIRGNGFANYMPNALATAGIYMYQSNKVVYQILFNDHTVELPHVPNISLTHTVVKNP